MFLSYASEDGPAVPRPLAEAPRALGVTVWLDELQLAIGKYLRQRVDCGIASITYSRARFGR